MKYNIIRNEQKKTNEYKQLEEVSDPYVKQIRNEKQ